jgi:hypothetical protein
MVDKEVFENCYNSNTINEVKQGNFQGILSNFVAGTERNIFGSTTLPESLSKYFNSLNFDLL